MTGDEITTTSVPGDAAEVLWVCAGSLKHCNRVSLQPAGVSAMQHICTANAQLRTPMKVSDKEIPETSEISGQTEKKRVASSESTNKPPTIQEDSNMATKRATPKTAAKPKAAKAKEVKDDGTTATRRSFGGRGWLAVEIDKVCRKATDLPLPVGEIVKQITNAEGEHPSTGAVSAAVTRWADQGYCKIKTERPLSFNGFTAKYKDKSFDEFLEDSKAKRAKARAAAKADA